MIVTKKWKNVIDPAQGDVTMTSVVWNVAHENLCTPGNWLRKIMKTCAAKIDEKRRFQKDSAVDHMKTLCPPRSQAEKNVENFWDF